MSSDDAHPVLTTVDNDVSSGICEPRYHELRLRPLAETDLLDIARRYRAAGGEELSARSREAARTALRSIEQTPGLGSPVIGNVCDVPGPRARRIKGYPYRWFYFVRVQ
jgi:toxin ParE1/3/4